jgi:hypothetical protein
MVHFDALLVASLLMGGISVVAKLEANADSQRKFTVRILGNEYTRTYWFDKTTVLIAVALLVGLALTHFARSGVALRGMGGALIQLAIQPVD